MKNIFYGLCFFLFAQVGQALQAEKIIELGDVIWGMTEIDDSTLLLTVRSGQFKLLNLKTKKSQDVKSSLTVVTGGQGGLLDVEVHPEFASNRKIYFTYSCAKEEGENTTCLGSGKLSSDRSAISNISELFAAEPAIDSQMHFGSRIAWETNRTLFMTVGDRYSQRDSAQDLSTHLGKVLHLDDKGRAVKGNPFEKTPGAKPEIFSLGHRNPQGLFFEQRNKVLWESEHGAKGGDEINQIEAGKNYGWPVITHGVDYNGDKIGEGKEKPGMEQPFYFYVPSIAPSGLILASNKSSESLRNTLLSGALVLQHLNQIQLNARMKEARHFESLNERIRDIIELKNGNIYFSTDSGKIFLIK